MPVDNGFDSLLGAAPTLGGEVCEAELAAGTVVADRFQVKALMGRSVACCTYHAVDDYTQADVALKTVTFPPGTDNETVSRFKREIGASRELRHPCIVPVYDLGQWQGGWFYTMRLLAGGTLRERMGDSTFGVDARLETVRRVARGLEHAHARTVHGHIKPENILFDEEGRAYLGDFGAAWLDADPAFRRPEAHGLTKLHYGAPEWLRGEEVDPSADVYSLGVVLYEMLVGAPPMFRSPTPSEVAEGVGPEVDAIVARALRPNPADRWPSVAEMMLALDQKAAASVPAAGPTRRVRDASRSKPEGIPEPSHDDGTLSARSSLLRTSYSDEQETVLMQALTLVMRLDGGLRLIRAGDEDAGLQSIEENLVSLPREGAVAAFIGQYGTSLYARYEKRLGSRMVPLVVPHPERDPPAFATLPKVKRLLGRIDGELTVRELADDDELAPLEAIAVLSFLERQEEIVVVHRFDVVLLGTGEDPSALVDVILIGATVGLSREQAEALARFTPSRLAHALVEPKAKALCDAIVAARAAYQITCVDDSDRPEEVNAEIRREAEAKARIPKSVAPEGLTWSLTLTDHAAPYQRGVATYAEACALARQRRVPVDIGAEFDEPAPRRTESGPPVRAEQPFLKLMLGAWLIKPPGADDLSRIAAALGRIWDSTERLSDAVGTRNRDQARTLSARLKDEVAPEPATRLRQVVVKMLERNDVSSPWSDLLAMVLEATPPIISALAGVEADLSGVGKALGGFFMSERRWLNADARLDELQDSVARARRLVNRLNDCIDISLLDRVRSRDDAQQPCDQCGGPYVTLLRPAGLSGPLRFCQYCRSTLGKLSAARAPARTPAASHPATRVTATKVRDVSRSKPEGIPEPSHDDGALTEEQETVLKQAPPPAVRLEGGLAAREVVVSEDAKRMAKLVAMLVVAVLAYDTLTFGWACLIDRPDSYAKYHDRLTLGLWNDMALSRKGAREDEELRKEDARKFGEAMEAGTIRALEDYLQHAPPDAHQGEAKDQRRVLIERAFVAYRAVAKKNGATPGAVEFIRLAEDFVRRSGQRQFAVVLTNATEQPPPDTPSLPSIDGDLFAGHLEQRVESALANDVLQFRRRKQAAQGALTLEVEYVAIDTGRVYSSKSVFVKAVQFAFTARISVPGSPPHVFASELAVHPPEKLVAKYFREHRDAPDSYDVQRALGEEALAKLEAHILSQLGLPTIPPPGRTR